MRFFFIRHGESLWNAKRLCQGQQDIELSPQGIQEAKLFAQKSALFPVGYICTSPLRRALHTAQIIQERHPSAGFRVLNEFSERSWGVLEGISSDAMYQIEEKEESDPHFVLDPSIEPRSLLKARIQQGLTLAFEFHPEPLIVSHGRLFLTLCELLQVPTVRQIKNLSLMEFTKTPQGWHVQELHLD